MKRLLFGHTWAGFLIHTLTMIVTAYFGSRVLTTAVEETILKVQPPVQVKKEARLILSPASSLMIKGKQIAVQIVVYPGAVNINTVGATVRYPAKLKAVRLSRQGSFCTLYPEEKIDARARTVRIGCGTPSPGLTSSAGVVGTIVFQAVETGSAAVEIDLAESSVHANDGKGTNVLARVEGSVLGVGEEKPAPKAKEIPLPARVMVSSPTHPDQERWYKNVNPATNWIQEQGVTGYATLLDRNPASSPDLTVLEKRGVKQFSDLEDGVWYFHIRARNSAGFGPVSHFKIQIDNTPPQLNIQTSATDVDEGGDVTVTFSGEDAEEFLVRIDNESFEPAESPVTFSNLSRGRHDIYVRALDRAGNLTERSIPVYARSPNLGERIGDWLRRFLFKR